MTTDHADYSDFIRHMIADDLESGVDDGRVVTRFPPEPNGYLHIGHAKSICLNFGIAEEIPGARCNLRFDDTNPTKEDEEYTESIQKDVRWLGFDWGERVYYASDYFDRLHEMAVLLIKDGKAYVDSLSQDEIREYRGTLTEPGSRQPPPHEARRGKPGPVPQDEPRRVQRRRSCPEGQDRHEFPQPEHARPGVVPDFEGPSRAVGATSGSCTPCTTTPIPCPTPWSTSPIRCAHLSSRTTGPCTIGWWTTCLCPAVPRQTEFARLNLSYTVMSKRRLLELVEGGHVFRMGRPTDAHHRRPAAPRDIRLRPSGTFGRKVGVARRDNVIDIALLEHSVREDLNARAPRRMAVLRPLKLVIENYPEGQVEELEAVNNPEDPSAGDKEGPLLTGQSTSTVTTS